MYVFNTVLMYYRNVWSECVHVVVDTYTYWSIFYSDLANKGVIRLRKIRFSAGKERIYGEIDYRNYSPGTVMQCDRTNYSNVIQYKTEYTQLCTIELRSGENFIYRAWIRFAVKNGDSLTHSKYLNKCHKSFHDLRTFVTFQLASIIGLRHETIRIQRSHTRWSTWSVTVSHCRPTIWKYIFAKI